jgi:hypothetical protein
MKMKIRLRATFHKWFGDDTADRWLTTAVIVGFILMIIAAYTVNAYAAEPFTSFDTFAEHHDMKMIGQAEQVGWILSAVDKGCSEDCVTTYWLLYKHFGLGYSGLAVWPLTWEQVVNLTEVENESN